MNKPQTTVKNFGPLEYPSTHPKYGQPHPQRIFLETVADIALYGGSRGPGKTWALIYDPLRYSRTAGFNGVIFRRDWGQIMMGGGPWETAESIWPWSGATSKGPNWYWPSGARVEFSHMHEDKDWRKWLGAQIPYIGFDQLEMFEEKQFISMLASNRDPNGVCQPCVRATANPEPGWLADFISWYWDPQTGYPIMERSGIIRWFIRKGDSYKWADSAEALKQQYPGCFPKSFTFVAAFTDDNTVLMEKDPTYMGNLLAQDAVTQERWIRGNWKVKPAAGMIFNRNWWNPPGKPSQIIELGQLPTALENFRWVRSWDIASTAEEEGGDPDWTAGVKMGMYAGQFFVRNVKRARRTPKETEDFIRETAAIDGVACAIRMNEGAHEKLVVSHYARNILPGYDFMGVPTQGRNKVLRAGPYSSAVQAGNVFLIRDGHDDGWIGEYIDELDAFQGLDEKNDQVDGSTDAHFTLTANTGAWDASLLRGVSIGEHNEGVRTPPHFEPRRLHS